MTPKICITVHNAEPYLRKLLSVLAQTLQGIEYLCINDGSTDDSLAILEEFATKDNRFHIFNQSKQGVGPASDVSAEYRMDNKQSFFVPFYNTYSIVRDVVNCIFNKHKEIAQKLKVVDSVSDFSKSNQEEYLRNDLRSILLAVKSQLQNPRIAIEYKNLMREIYRAIWRLLPKADQSSSDYRLADIVIFGTGQFARQVKRSFENEYPAEKIIGFVSYDSKLSECRIEGLPIFSVDWCLKGCNKAIRYIIIATSYQCEAKEEIDAWNFKTILSEQGYAGIAYTVPLHPFYYFNKIKNSVTPIKYIGINTQPKPSLFYLETHLTEHCNLKCRGCSHYANLVHEPIFPALENFARDMKRLGELFCNIDIIRLMGGEPFLNPEWSKWLHIARQTFPNTQLCLVTNGLLLLTQPSTTWKTLKEYCVTLTVTLYPPIQKIWHKIENLLSMEGVSYSISKDKMGDIVYFDRCLTQKDDNSAFQSVTHCRNAKCCNLVDGKIYKCPICAYANRLNPLANHFYDNSKSAIDIYEKSITGIDILRKLSEPIDFCKYCKFPTTKLEWTNKGEPQLEDWVNL